MGRGILFLRCGDMPTKQCLRIFKKLCLHKIYGENDNTILSGKHFNFYEFFKAMKFE